MSLVRRTAAPTKRRWIPLALVATMAVQGTVSRVQGQEPFDRLQDRGPGIPVSMFGTYIREGEFLLYPFFEYYHDGDTEYSPDDFGYPLDRDFRGKFVGREWLIWAGYGITDRLSVELEAAYMSARLDKAADDPSQMPARITESELGDVEGQIRYLWAQETERRPGLFSYFETVFPLKDRYSLVGTTGWEFKLGTGVIRAFPWGTTTLRASIAYDEAENLAEIGEYAVEYMKRLSPAIRVFAGVEGSQDEVELITEAQWFLRRDIFLKLNNAFGLTSKATDWAPEIGLMFSFR